MVIKQLNTKLLERVYLRWIRNFHFYLLICLFGVSFHIKNVFASLYEYPSSPAKEALSDSAPTAFAPFPFEANDFQVIWQENNKNGESEIKLKNLRFWLAKDSIQWVRVGDLNIIPRARLIVEVEVDNDRSIFEGHLSHYGYSQPFVLQKPNIAEDPFIQTFTESLTKSVTMMIRDQTGKVIPWVASPVVKDLEQRRVMRAEIPVALLSGNSNKVSLRGVKLDEEINGFFSFKFSPQKKFLPHELLSIDSSCSQFAVLPRLPEIQLSTWVHIGCRQLAVKSEAYRTTSLEFYIVWDQFESIEPLLNGVPLTPLVENVWALRMRSQPGFFELRSKHEKIALIYRTPEEFKYGFLGFGLGPYSYFYRHQSERKGATNIATAIALGTIYGSYFITDTVRLVAFDAFSVHSQFFNDLGVYINTESFRAIDRRLKVNVMLGAHVLNFKIGNTHYAKIGAPQGIEAIYQDAFVRGYNFAAGAFIYPKIEGKSYYNVWFRWGPPKWFFEFNFIEWQERVGNDTLESRSAGLSVGLPVFRFL